MNDNVDGDDDGLNGGHVVVNVKIQFYRTDYTLKSLLRTLPMCYVIQVEWHTHNSQNNKELRARDRKWKRMETGKASVNVRGITFLRKIPKLLAWVEGAQKMKRILSDFFRFQRHGLAPH